MLPPLLNAAEQVELRAALCNVRQRLDELLKDLCDASDSGLLSADYVEALTLHLNCAYTSGVHALNRADSVGRAHRIAMLH